MVFQAIIASLQGYFIVATSHATDNISTLFMQCNKQTHTDQSL